MSEPRTRRLSPEGVRRLLERLGPTLIKVGQLLAQRPDLVDENYRDQLLQLKDPSPPLAYDVVRAILTEDLGAAPEQLFSRFNPHPASSGLLAQVHAARTHDGVEVAVKVARPGIRETVERDLAHPRVMSRILEAVGAGDLTSPRELAASLVRAIREELDFDRELTNVSRFHDLAEQGRPRGMPRPFPELCGARVLTTEYRPGIPLSDVLTMVQAGDVARLERMAIDPRRVGANFVRAVFDQIFRLELFLTTNHPMSVVATTGNRVAFVDFGRIDYLDPSLRQGMTHYMAALQAQDLDRMFEGLTELVVADERSDLEQLRLDFLDASQQWQRERDHAEHAATATGRYLLAILHSARRNGFRVPSHIVSLCRTLVTVEAVAHQLGNRRDLAELGVRVFKRVRARARRRALRLDVLEPALLDILRLFRDGPRRLRRVLIDLADGRLFLRVRTVASDDDLLQASLRARLVCLAIVSVALTFLLGWAKGQNLPAGIPVSWLVWLGLVVDGAWMALLWRRLR